MGRLAESELMCRIALVNPPFASIHTPSIQLGLIKSLCSDVNVPVDDLYANIDLAAELGVRRYQAICFAPSPELGEWLFGAAAFGDAVPPAPYLKSFEAELQRFTKQAGIALDEIIDLRQNRIPRWVEARAADLARYPVAAFTSTFQQNVAGIALARHTKRLNPSTIIVMGGANYHGPMGREYFRALDFLDYVATGEADHIVADLFAALLRGDALNSRVGLLARHDAGAGATERDSIYLGSMDALPTPDYNGYFAALAQHGITVDELGHAIALPFESSRGCWWGAKHHCTFCGLNSVGMQFRSKSPERVGEEVAALVKTYGIARLDATDNIIERKKMSALMDTYRAIGRDLDFFYEIKANVSPDDVRLMRRSGIRRVQPGIESFSSNVLKLMNKGTTGLNNINALRWFLTFDVDPLWNILYGFPGETAQDYREQARLVPLLLHLSPPQVMTRINIDRFSPNFELPEMRELFSTIKPFSSYAHLYAREIDIEKVAYHFVGVPREALGEADYLPFFRAIRHWKNVWNQNELTPFTGLPVNRPMLSYSKQADGSAVILDTRARIDQPRRVALDGVTHELLKSFFFRPASIEQAFLNVAGQGFHDAVVRDAYHDLLDLNLIVQEGAAALALPVLSTCSLDEPIAQSQAKTVDDARLELV